MSDVCVVMERLGTDLHRVIHSGVCFDMEYVHFQGVATIVAGPHALLCPSDSARSGVPAQVEHFASVRSLERLTITT